MAIAFGQNFLQDHVHSLLRQPDIAVTELIANSYDAGATRVDIGWPDTDGGEISVEDNGTGMSPDELQRRWFTLCYDRAKEQGSKVVFPPGVDPFQRIAFGQSGKGRHAMFCFANSYSIDTWKDGLLTRAVVTKTDGGPLPFALENISTCPQDGHGTRLSVRVDHPRLAVPMVRELVGTKFLVDPSFAVYINGELLDLIDVRAIVVTDLPVQGLGTVRVRLLASPNRNRTMQLRGITWWVLGRIVGKPSWDGLDGHGSILDGRTTEAHKYSFIVEADMLKEDVSSDWSGFKISSPRVDRAKRVVHDHVTRELTNVLVASKLDRKKEAVRVNAGMIRPLPKVSRTMIGEFIDTVQEQCHRISADDLDNLVGIMAKMESARTGYDLLRKLAACSPDDIDTWNAIMQEWDATRAQIVLGELGRRMDMIKELERKAHDPTVRELCELQPLFEGNLWVFGPEYECVDFTSNRTMVTVLKRLFKVDARENLLKRPDFVVLEDGTVGAYSAPDYENGEVEGIRKVLIVELKRGGFTLHQSEMIQGLDYANEIREKAGLTASTEIVVRVLGAQIGRGVNTRLDADSTHVEAMIFNSVLDKANARTFHLLARIRETVGIGDVASDPVLEDTLGEPVLFEADTTAQSPN